MERFKSILVVSCLTLSVMACAALSAPSVVSPETATTPTATSVEVDAYDVMRDPAEDLQQAVIVAQYKNKRILLEVGGDWCVWCHIMDEFYVAHSDLLNLRRENYILVKVNYSPENKNEKFLSQYPAIDGYPHIFILESDGNFLRSQDTAELEEGESYNLDKFTTFLQEWTKP